MTKIKPCPICGSEACWFTNYLEHLYITEHYVECIGECDFSGTRCETKSEAIAAWNRMVTEIEVGREVMQLPKVTDEMTDLLVKLKKDIALYVTGYPSIIHNPEHDTHSDILRILQQLKAIQERGVYSDV